MLEVSSSSPFPFYFFRQYPKGKKFFRIFLKCWIRFMYKRIESYVKDCQYPSFLKCCEKKQRQCMCSQICKKVKEPNSSVVHNPGMTTRSCWFFSSGHWSLVSKDLLLPDRYLLAYVNKYLQIFCEYFLLLICS